MEQLALSSTDEFLSQFYNFYDGIIREVKILFWGGYSDRIIEVTVSVKAASQLPDDAWTNLLLRFEGVSEFRFVEDANSYNQILSNGVQILGVENLVFFDFSPYTDEPSGVDDFRKSDFYVAAKGVFWTRKSYAE